MIFIFTTLFSAVWLEYERSRLIGAITRTGSETGSDRATKHPFDEPLHAVQAYILNQYNIVLYLSIFKFDLYCMSHTV